MPKDLHKSFIEMADPSEYKFAIKYFATWKAWEEFTQANLEEVESWRRELQAKLQSESFDKIIELAFTDSKEAFQACKYLVEKFSTPTVSKRGRPSKEEINQRTEELVQENQRISKDLRILEI